MMMNFGKPALPLCARLFAFDTRFNDAQVIFAVFVRHAETVKTGLGLRQQAVQDEVPDRVPATVNPCSTVTQADMCRAVEIVLCIGKRQRRFGRIDAGCIVLHESVIKSDIRDIIDDAGCAGHGAVLDAEMGRSIIIEADQGAVPAPDRAVMQPQVVQLFRFAVITYRQ